MKLLHVSEFLPGGTAGYLQEIVPAQVRRYGVGAVTLLVPGDQTAHLGALTQDGAPMPGLGLDTYRRTGRNGASLLRLAVALRAAVRRHRPDIVHLHNAFAGMVGRLALGGPDRPAIAYCAHCWAFARGDTGLATRLYAGIERALLPRTDLIVDISPHERVLRRRHGLGAAPAVLVQSGLADAAPAAPLRRRPGEPLRLLYIGRTGRQKGFDLLAAEAAALDPARAHLTVVGGNPFATDRADLMPPHVTVLGWVPRERIPALVEEADAVVMPSRWEGLPLAALEVQRAGRPLLASAVEPFGVIVEDGVSGLLMDIDRPGFLARALARLETMDLPAMGAAARESFERGFKAERMIRDLDAAYARLLGGTAEAPLAPAEPPEWPAPEWPAPAWPMPGWTHDPLEPAGTPRLADPADPVRP